MLTRLTILLVHIIVSLILGYISFNIVTQKPMPVFVGILIGLTALTVLTYHLYVFSSDKKDNFCCGKNDERARGLHFDPDDPDYKPIGGIPKGITWA